MGIRGINIVFELMTVFAIFSTILTSDLLYSSNMELKKQLTKNSVRLPLKSTIYAKISLAVGVLFLLNIFAIITMLIFNAPNRYLMVSFYTHIISFFLSSFITTITLFLVHKTMRAFRIYKINGFYGTNCYVALVYAGAFAWILFLVYSCSFFINSNK